MSNEGCFFYKIKDWFCVVFINIEINKRERVGILLVVGGINEIGFSSFRKMGLRF